MQLAASLSGCFADHLVTRPRSGSEKHHWIHASCKVKCEMSFHEQ